MGVTPLWFGEANLFGFLHTPDDGMVRASIVICPPLGSEHLWSYAILRRLADELEALGFVVLRFDYEGTGQSAGDLQRAWPAGGLLSSVEAALELVRSTSASPVALVGMRLGTTLAGVLAAGGETIAALVLWDPVTSGSAFLRDQKALRMLGSFMEEGDASGTGAEEGRPGEILGFVYTPEGVADLKQLDLLKAGPKLGATPVLALLPATAPTQQAARLQAAIAADWAEAPSLRDAFFEETIPEAGIQKIAAWLDAALPTVRNPAHSAQGRETLDIGLSSTGTMVTERVLWLGPLGLFAIETAAADAPSCPSVLFLDQALEPPIGPGRMWVDLGRALAKSGMRVVRFNCSGVGDSPVRPGQVPDVVYAPEAVQDVLDAVFAVVPENPRQVVLVGLSSGAYNAMEAARSLFPLGVCLINPPTLDDRKLYQSGALGRVALPRRPWLHALSKNKTLDKVRLGLPEIGWRLLDVSRVARSPARSLIALADNGVDVLLVCGTKEGRQFDRRGGWIARRLVRRNRLQFELIPGLDHTLYYPEQDRLAVRALILNHVHTCLAAIQASSSSLDLVGPQAPSG